jgi:hypothetical protein
MKSSVRDWLLRLGRPAGVLACGVGFPDQTSLCHSYSRAYPLVALEHTWQGLADTFRVLALHRLPTRRAAWVYEQAVLRCARRDDGLVLFVFVAPAAAESDAPALDHMITEFEALSPALGLAEATGAGRLETPPRLSLATPGEARPNRDSSTTPADHRTPRL